MTLLFLDGRTFGTQHPGVDPEVQKLLDLQDVDLHLQQTQAALRRAPIELEKLATEEAREKADLEAKEQAFKGLEIRRKEIDGALQDAEAQVVKYKTQQLQVKKNEEYQALNHEIDSLGQRISGYEEEEIGLMLEIDEAQLTLGKDREASAERLTTIARERRLIQDNVQKLQAEVAELEAKVAAARAPVNALYQSAYDASKLRHPRGPYVTPILDGRCEGCHLKVSGETTSALRQPDGPVKCDQCGRVVYVG
ncbi:MAG: zinc ribbon domain-containing protein [Opitutales bacterium]